MTSKRAWNGLKRCWHSGGQTCPATATIVWPRCESWIANSRLGLLQIKDRQTVNHGRFAIELQPGNTGLLRDFEDRGQIGFRRHPVTGYADIDDAAAVGRVGVDRQLVIGQFQAGA